MAYGISVLAGLGLLAILAACLVMRHIRRALSEDEHLVMSEGRRASLVALEQHARLDRFWD